MRRPSRLAVRIYLTVLVQFLVVALALEASRRASTLPPFGEKQARFVADDLARVYDDPPRLVEEVERVARTLEWTIEVRDGAGRVVARADAPTLRDQHPMPRARAALPLNDGRVATLDYDVFPPGPPPGLSSPATFGLVLLVSVVASVLMARSLTRPLAVLASVARDLGAGKLEVRARFARTDEIGEVAQAFDDMAGRLTRLVLAERELLANVSHELRTPLARVRVALDIAREAGPEQALEAIADIGEDLAELERLVDDVLASARLAQAAAGGPAAALPLRKERIETRALLERSVVKFRARHRERALEARFDDALPDLVVDPVLVRRVVDNLLENAHKYSRAAGGPIALEARRADGGVTIVVRDRGVGLAPADLARVFEPFFRADRSRSKATGGLGLGLTLVRHVVAAHGGTVDLASEPGAGTVATVTLPAVDAEGAGPAVGFAARG